MLSLTRIIAPVDFSERSTGAARYAGRLACHFHSELTLLHVLDPRAFASVDTGSGLSAEWRLQAETHLGNFLPGEFRNMNVRRLILCGDPAAEIVRFTHSAQAGLMVIPTHGYGPFRQFLLGSVTTKILHDADCPVLTGVHMMDSFPEGSRSFRKILCAVDFCPQSMAALEWAAQFADEFHAELTIVHITPSVESRVGGYFDAEGHGRPAMDALQHEYATRALRKVEAMQKTAGINAAVLVHDSVDVPKAVCSAAAQLQADLIVVGRGSSAGAERRRTKVYSIVRQSLCPVVSI